MSPVAKAVMAGVVTPLVVTDLRVAGAMLLFWTASLFRRPEHVPPADMMKLFGASLLAIVFNQGCFIFGVGMTSPVDASIITTSMPLVAMILAAFSRSRSPARNCSVSRRVRRRAAAILGSGWRGSGPGPRAANPSGATCWCCWRSAAMRSISYCSKNFVGRYSPVTIMKWMFTYSFVCLLPFSYNDLIATEDGAGAERVAVAGL